MKPVNQVLLVYAGDETATIKGVAFENFWNMAKLIPGAEAQ
ncbi:MAG: hypothetical protein WCT05_10895 [Lentisphaeria bacterium]